jgi:hypothetical protein
MVLFNQLLALMRMGKSVGPSTSKKLDELLLTSLQVVLLVVQITLTRLNRLDNRLSCR